MQTDFAYDSTPSFVRQYVLTASRYTGKERDTESGLDYFGARYYGSNMGRFTSPDFQNLDDGDTPEALPSGTTSNPQTLNLYGYVENNPLSKRDFDGHASYQDNGNGQLTWQGDYDGERDCSGSAGCLFWNSKAGEWQGSDPNPPPDDPTGAAFTGFTRMLLSKSWGDFNYGFRESFRGYAQALQNGPTPLGIGLAIGVPLIRPSFVPKDWIEKPSNKGTGTKFVDPENPHNSVRLEPAKPGSSNPGQQRDYMVVTKNGQTLDSNGNPVPRQSLDSHIPQGTELPPDTFPPPE